MCHGILGDARLYALLLKYDEDLAAQARAGGCECGGVLHVSDFPRKPRGGPSDLGGEHDRRLSFCCDRDGCRGRVTPPSVRFLGRRVYLGAVVVLVSAMRNGPTPERVAKLVSLIGASRRTLERWRRWWRRAFAESAFWKGRVRAVGDAGSAAVSAAVARRALRRQRARSAGGGAAIPFTDHEQIREECHGFVMSDLGPQKMRGDLEAEGL